MKKSRQGFGSAFVVSSIVSQFILTMGAVGANAQTPVGPPEKSYQVIVSHPHEVKHILPYIQTRYQGGRLWIVDLKNPRSTPAWVFKSLRKADPARLRHYAPGLKETTRFFAPQISKQVLNSISTDAIQAGVLKVSSFKKRSTGSADNQAAQKWIETELKGLGYDVKLSCHAQNACSVVADKKGQSKPEEVILVEGHFDSVGHDFAGADDNATGTAVTLEMARVLKSHGNKRTFRFFLTNGEEQGLLGAEHYAKQIAQSGQTKNIKLVINMDMVGYNQNGIVELETDAEWNGLAQWFAGLAEKHTTLKSKITLGAWGSDHVPFLKLGIPSLLTIEDWSTKTPCYHQACDKPDTVNYKYATEIAKLNTAAVLSKDAE